MKHVVVLTFAVAVGFATDARCQQMGGTPAATPLPLAWMVTSAADAHVAPADRTCAAPPQSNENPVVNCSFGAPRCASAAQCTTWCYPLASQCLSGCCACSS